MCVCIIINLIIYCCLRPELFYLTVLENLKLKFRVGGWDKMSFINSFSYYLHLQNNLITAGGTRAKILSYRFATLVA